MLAMSLASILRWDTPPSKDVLSLCSEFEVLRIYALRVEAQMVYLEPIWDGSYESFIDHLVGAVPLPFVSDERIPL